MTEIISILIFSLYSLLLRNFKNKRHLFCNTQQNIKFFDLQINICWFNWHPIEFQTKRKRLQKQDFKTLKGLLVLLMSFREILLWGCIGFLVITEGYNLNKVWKHLYYAMVVDNFFLHHYILYGGEGWLEFPDLWSGQKSWWNWYLTPVVNFGEVRRAQVAKSILLTSILVPLGSFKVCSDAKERVACRKQWEATAPIYP